MIASRHIAPVNFWGLTKQVGPWKTTAVDKTHEALGYDSPHNQVQEVRPYQQNGSKAPTYEQVEIVSDNNINGLRGPGLRAGKIQREGLSTLDERRIDRLGDRIAKRMKIELGTVGGDLGGNMGMTLPPNLAQVRARIERNRERLQISTEFRDPNSGAVVITPSNSSAASSSVNSGNFHTASSGSFGTSSPGDNFGAGTPSSGSSFAPSDLSTVSPSDPVIQGLERELSEQELEQRLEGLLPDVQESPVAPPPAPTFTSVQLAPMNIAPDQSIVERREGEVAAALGQAADVEAQGINTQLQMIQNFGLASDRSAAALLAQAGELGVRETRELNLNAHINRLNALIPLPPADDQVVVDTIQGNRAPSTMVLRQRPNARQRQQGSAEPRRSGRSTRQANPGSAIGDFTG